MVYGFHFSFRKAEEEKQIVEKLKKELGEEKNLERQQELQRQLEKHLKKGEELRFGLSFLLLKSSKQVLKLQTGFARSIQGNLD